jgi:hypothetical protein
MEGPFLVKSLWIKLWNFAKSGCKNPGHVAPLRLFGAGVMLGKGSFISAVNDIG